jgi:hypothetical protein
MAGKWKLLVNPAALGWFLIKVGAYATVVLVFAVSVFVIVHRDEMRLIARFQALREVDPLPEARRLADAGMVCDALEYLDYFLEYEYVQQNIQVTAFAAELRAKRESWAFRGKDVLDGIWKGKGACLESMVSATAADFFVVGDVRDLAWETVKWYQGQEVDEFTAALAGAGVVLAVATYGTGGAAAPAKGSVSLLKVAKRLEKLPKPLQKALVVIFREAKEVKSLKPLEPMAESLSTIAKTPGVRTRDVMEVLARSQKVSDLKTMEQVVSAYGKNTAKFLKLGGEGSIEVVQKFGKGREVLDAVRDAAKYGPEGTKLVADAGPKMFLRWAKITKYGVRAVRTTYKERLTLTLSWILRLLPEWALYMVAGLTGFVGVGVPAWKARAFIRNVRASSRQDTGIGTQTNDRNLADKVG